MKTIILLPLLLGTLVAAHAQNLLQTVWTTNIYFPENVTSLAFSGNSERLASSSWDFHLDVWTLTTNAPIRSIYTFNASFVSVALNSDGSLVGAGSGGASRLWRVSDGVRIAAEFPSGEVVWSVNFSPDDSYFAMGRTDGVNVWYVPIRSGVWFQEIQTFSVTFSPDGRWLATGNADRTARLWDARNGTAIRSFAGHAGAVRSGDFSVDSSLLATGCDDEIVRLWNVTNGAPILSITNAGRVVKFLGDGSYLMSLEPLVSHQFKIFRTSDGKYMGGYTNTDALCFALSRDGRYFAYGNSSGTVTLAYAPLINEGFTRERRQSVLHWTGGSGYYQVQRRYRERGSHWRNFRKPTIATSARVTDRPHFAYRVISLPPP